MFPRSTTGGLRDFAPRARQRSPEVEGPGRWVAPGGWALVVLAMFAPAAACGSAQVSVTAEASAHASRVVFEAPPPEPDDDPGIPPSRTAVWSAGFWNWTGVDYEWVAGEWMAARPGYVWVSAHWRPQGRGHLFVPGRWRRTDAGPPLGE